MKQKDIKLKIDLVWNTHLTEKYHNESEKYFGKNY